MSLTDFSETPVKVARTAAIAADDVTPDAIQHEILRVIRALETLSEGEIIAFNWNTFKLSVQREVPGSTFVRAEIETLP